MPVETRREVGIDLLRGGKRVRGHDRVAVDVDPERRLAHRLRVVGAAADRPLGGPRLPERELPVQLRRLPPVALVARHAHGIAGAVPGAADVAHVLDGRVKRDVLLTLDVEVLVVPGAVVRGHVESRVPQVERAHHRGVAHVADHARVGYLLRVALALDEGAEVDGRHHHVARAVVGHALQHGVLRARETEHAAAVRHLERPEAAAEARLELNRGAHVHRARLVGEVDPLEHERRAVAVALDAALRGRAVRHLLALHALSILLLCEEHLPEVDLACRVAQEAHVACDLVDDARHAISARRVGEEDAHRVVLEHGRRRR